MALDEVKDVIDIVFKILYFICLCIQVEVYLVATSSHIFKVLLMGKIKVMFYFTVVFVILGLVQVPFYALE